jgi:AcrR family transcriptional regulator
MRRLGSELGVDPMAVYYYVPNKDALLDAIVEAVMSEIDLEAEDCAADPEERILSAANAYLAVMLAHSNALPIMLSRGPSTPAAARPVEYLIGVLRDAGLPPAEAMAGMNAIAAAVRGSVGMLAAAGTRSPTAERRDALAAHFSAHEFPYLTEAATAEQDFHCDFEFGVRALARGLLAEADVRSTQESR